MEWQMPDRRVQRRQRTTIPMDTCSLQTAREDTTAIVCRRGRQSRRRRYFPRNEVRGSRMAPGHVAPVVTVRVPLEEDMVEAGGGIIA